MLYEAALENGDPYKQIHDLAVGNKVSEEEIIDVLKRNECDVEAVMAKRGRPRKESKAPVVIKQDIAKAVLENNDKKEKKDMEEKVVEERVTVDAPVIPALVYDLIKEKINDYNKLIEVYEEKLADIKQKQEELSAFAKQYD